MSQQLTYGQLLLKAMRDCDPPMTRTALHKQTSFSYEHLRKVVAGLPLMSDRFNAEVCRILGLDEEAMWQVALREKNKRNGPEMFAMVVPDTRLKKAWEALNLEDQERLLKIAEGIAEQRAAEKNEEDETDPDVIQERINHLMGKMRTAASNDKNRRGRGLRAAV